MMKKYILSIIALLCCIATNAQLVSYEYWFDDDYHPIQVNISGSTATITELNTVGVSPGLHQWHLRVKKSVNQTAPPNFPPEDFPYSSVTSGMFLKLSAGNFNSVQCWFDNDPSSNRQTITVTDGQAANINATGLTQGLHSLNYRVSTSDGVPVGATYSEYFFKLPEGNFNSVQYWFDDDPSGRQTITAPEGQNLILKDIGAGSLDEGVHRITYRLSTSSGMPVGTTYTDYFFKGYKPEFTDYAYSFDNAKNGDTIAIAQPANPYTLNTSIAMPDTMSKGGHTIQLKFRDNRGRWYGAGEEDAFISTGGTITAAKIKNLEPNINLYSPTVVKAMATVYRYYQIVDANDNPVADAIMRFKIGNSSPISAKSDISGFITVAAPVFGISLDDTNDDYVPVNGSADLEFIDLKLNNKVLDILSSTFLPVKIFSLPYYSAENSSSLEIGGELSGSTGDDSWIEGKLKANASFTLGFPKSYDDYDQLKDYKYEFEVGLGASGGLGFHLPPSIPKGILSTIRIPVLNLKGEISGEVKGKLKVQKDILTPLNIAYDLLWSTYESSGGVNNETLKGILLGIGDLLDDISPYEPYKGNISIDVSAGCYLNVPEGGGGFSVTDFIPWGDEILMSNFINVNVDLKGKMGSEFGYGINASAGILSSSSSSMKQVTEGGIEYKGSLLDVFGAGYEDATANSVKYKREYNNLFLLNGASLEIEQARKGSGELKVLGIVDFNYEYDKTYSYKYSIKQPVFDYLRNYPNAIQTNTSDKSYNSIWGYFTNKQNLGCDFTTDISKYEEALQKGISKLDFKSNPSLFTAFELELSKEYSTAMGLSFGIESPDIASFLGFDFDVSITGKGTLTGTYPLGKKIYYPPKDTMLYVTEYFDDDKAIYFFSPLDAYTEYLNYVTDALTNWASSIWDKAKSFWKSTTGWVSNLGNFFSNKSSSNASPLRLYSKSLIKYSQLRSDRQTDISIMEFDIPSDYTAFSKNTEMKFSYYYPGGEVLGSTVAQDTFIVISDLFFLSAYYNGDTLAIAPNGNFKIFATAGADDLSFLDLNSSYPVGVYHKAFSDSLWHPIGNVNDTIYFNELGKFCLGVSVNSDKEPPIITISKQENADKVEITITDNMAVFWKNVAVLLNGVVTECERTGSVLQVPLTAEQQSGDIYITVYATDLARNEAQATAVFNAPTGIKTITNQSVCKLYPNPATDLCNLFVPSELRSEKTAYAIVNPAGMVYRKELIKSDETKIDVSRLSAGVYFVVVYNDNRIIANIKLIKK